MTLEFLFDFLQFGREMKLLETEISVFDCQWQSQSTSISLPKREEMNSLSRLTSLTNGPWIV